MFPFVKTPVCRWLAMLALGALASCSPPETQKSLTVSLEKNDPELDSVISNFSYEIIGEGYTWSEGPVWSDELQALLFSDVPENKVYQWQPENAPKVYLEPSGFTGSVHPGEKGANGLAIYQGQLYLCQHGDQRLAIMEAPLSSPKPAFTTLTDRWKGKKFNSPNDLHITPAGKVYFTDPPYGLPQGADDPHRDLSFQGVYVFSGDSTRLLVDSLTRPNGIVQLADGRILVANSDPAKAKWYAITTDTSSIHEQVTQVAIFCDATPEVSDQAPGLPDGLKVTASGYIMATGPGGIWIMNSTGKRLGRIRISGPSSNCALAENDAVLYVTSDAYVLKIKLR